MQRNRLVRAFLAAALLTSLAGCAYLPSAGSISIDYDGAPERTAEGFRMQGHVEVDGTAGPTRNFTDVAVVLYDRNRSVIKRVELGTMSTDPDHYPYRRPVNITTTQAPVYILIESPDFWQEGVSTIGFRWTGDRYERDYVDSREEIFR